MVRKVRYSPASPLYGLYRSLWPAIACTAPYGTGFYDSLWHVQGYAGPYGLYSVRDLYRMACMARTACMTYMTYMACAGLCGPYGPHLCRRGLYDLDGLHSLAGMDIYTGLHGVHLGRDVGQRVVAESQRSQAHELQCLKRDLRQLGIAPANRLG